MREPAKGNSMSQSQITSDDHDPEDDAPPADQSSGSAQSGNDSGDTDLAAEVEKWKSLSRKNEQRARENLAKAKRLDELETANASELERAVRKARQEAETELSAKYNRRLVSAEIKAAAGGKFNDPADAVAYLKDELDTFVSDDGEADAKAINRALDNLLKAKPYLGVVAKQEDKGTDFDAGARSGGSGTFDMNSLIRRQARVG